MLVPVYDIKNCGPRHRFAANGKLVHNSDSINMQNLPRKSPLKKTIAAPEGYWIVDCDSSQIEARTLAWLAQQEDLVEAFDKGEDVYKIMAGAIYGKKIEDITDEERFVGKTTVLGCFGPDTRVLTSNGWKRIVEVKATDMVWDGEEWVNHQGVIPRGMKDTLTSYGVAATPDHEILTEHGWRVWSEVVTSPTLFQSAISRANSSSCVGSSTLKTQAGLPGGILSSVVRAVGKAAWTGITSKQGAPPGVISVRKALQTLRVKNIGGTKILSPILSIDSGFLTASPAVCLGVTTQTAAVTATMAGEAYLYTSRGGKIERLSSRTLSISTVGTTQNSNSTAWITLKDMSRAISGLFLAKKTCLIAAPQEVCRRRLMTYDIAFAGPRNRYTIATSAGPIIVHNCGYGMGALKFQAQLKTFNVQMPLDECKRIIAVYRETYPMIPRLWREASEALDAMANNQTAPYGRDGVLTVAGEQGVYLPNGFRLQYPNLRWYRNGEKTELIYDTKKGKAVIPKRIWGGASVENVCQALARIAIGGQMLRIAKKYRVVMTVHDSVVSLVPEAEVEEAKDYIMRCMRMRPAWAPALPLNCEAKAGATYGG